MRVRSQAPTSTTCCLEVCGHAQAVATVIYESGRHKFFCRGCIAAIKRCVRFETLSPTS